MLRWAGAPLHWRRTLNLTEHRFSGAGVNSQIAVEWLTEHVGIAAAGTRAQVPKCSGAPTYGNKAGNQRFITNNEFCFIPTYQYFPRKPWFIQNICLCTNILC